MKQNPKPKSNKHITAEMKSKKASILSAKQALNINESNLAKLNNEEPVDDIDISGPNSLDLQDHFALSNNIDPLAPAIDDI